MFATSDDIDRCQGTVQSILREKGIRLDQSSIDEIVKKVLEITYATGGDYTEERLEAYARAYLREILIPGAARTRAVVRTKEESLFVRWAAIAGLYITCQTNPRKRLVRIVI